MDRGKEFLVEISNTRAEGYTTSTSLKLPVTWAEFQDALERTRIPDARHCDCEILKINAKHNGFLAAPLKSACRRGDTNLYELNLLAQRLTLLTGQQEINFEGMLKSEAGLSTNPLKLQTLVDLTFCLDNCCIASHVGDDKALGRLLHESEMLSEEAMTFVDTLDMDDPHTGELLALLGRQHREDTGGVFTSQGCYVEPDGSGIPNAYRQGGMNYFDRSGAPVVLELRKGFGGDPACDNGLTVRLDLPVGRSSVDDAVEQVEAASLKECGWRCLDCLVPQAREWINNAEDFEEVKQFADRLHWLERREAPVKYKALLDAAHCSCLEDAVTLADELEQYELKPEVNSTWGYAELRLREKYPDLPPALFQTGQGAAVGGRMLEEDHAALTGYGLLRRKDGQPLPDLRQEAIGMTQSMQ